LNGFLAYRIKKELGIPYIVSLHTNPPENKTLFRNALTRIYWECLERVEQIGLKEADLVLPVYEQVVPYLNNLGIKKYCIAYNMLNGEYLQKKRSYVLHHPIRIIRVGRLIPGLNPENIIRSVKDIPDLKLTIIGTGPLESYLLNLIKTLNLQKKIKLLRSVPNEKLCRMLPNFDVCVINSQYMGISKVLLEALLTGLPCIVNKELKDKVPELRGNFVAVAENNPEGYKKAISSVITNNTYRESLGKKAGAISQGKWSPQKNEDVYCQIYQRYVR
jgi:glycosyltransferase involved in cell wall biosynthesis